MGRGAAVAGRAVGGSVGALVGSGGTVASRGTGEGASVVRGATDASAVGSGAADGASVGSGAADGASVGSGAADGAAVGSSDGRGSGLGGRVGCGVAGSGEGTGRGEETIALGSGCGSFVGGAVTSGASTDICSGMGVPNGLSFESSARRGALRATGARSGTGGRR